MGEKERRVNAQPDFESLGFGYGETIKNFIPFRLLLNIDIKERSQTAKTDLGVLKYRLQATIWSIFTNKKRNKIKTVVFQMGTIIGCKKMEDVIFFCQPVTLTLFFRCCSKSVRTSERRSENKTDIQIQTDFCNIRKCKFRSCSNFVKPFLIPC